MIDWAMTHIMHFLVDIFGFRIAVEIKDSTDLVGGILVIFMAMPNLKCTVDTCNYWDNGNHCTADGIEVNNQVSSAETSDDTICKTFKPQS